MSDAGTYCLIGGTGFLGTALRRRLRRDGHDILIVGRAEQARTEAGERYMTSSEFAAFACNSGGERFAAVIDLAYATVPSTSVEDPVADFSANLRAVLLHLDAARALGALRYVFVSSGGTIYGDSGPQPLSEESRQQPISPYGISKLACEHYALLMHRLHGLPALVVRPSNVYGPGQQPFRGQGLIATAFAAALTGARVTVFGDGSHVRDFLYVEDFCDGLLAALVHGKPGQVYNIGSGEGLDVRTVLERIAMLVEANGCRLDIDWREGRPFDVRHNVLDVAKLRTASGWRPKMPFEEGLEATWDWMKDRARS